MLLVLWVDILFSSENETNQLTQPVGLPAPTNNLNSGLILIGRLTVLQNKSSIVY